MKKILISLSLLSSPLCAVENRDCDLKAKDFNTENNATIFWHWDTLYIEIEGHLYYCHELQHSVKCLCFDDDEIE